MIIARPLRPLSGYGVTPGDDGRQRSVGAPGASGDYEAAVVRRRAARPGEPLRSQEGDSSGRTGTEKPYLGTAFGQRESSDVDSFWRRISIRETLWRSGPMPTGREL
jgi:hypothetical protein